MKLDDIDLTILQTLQKDGGLSIAEIADKAGLTPSPCWRRIKRLEDEGVIAKRTIVIDTKSVGLNFIVYLTAKVAPATPANYKAFEGAIQTTPEIVEATTMTGQDDYLLKIAVPDIDAFDRFIVKKLIPMDVLGDFRSSVQVRVIKSMDSLPLDHLKSGKDH